MSARVDRLELLNRALLDLLLHHNVVDRNELSVMMQQVDLLDGVEDGAISESVHDAAPTCGACGRYVNPSRSHCVYCNTEMRSTGGKAPSLRMVDRSTCGTRIEERQSYFSDSGVVCSGCFS